MRSAAVRGRGLAAVTAVSVFVAFLAVAWGVTARKEWQARVTAALEPAPDLNVSLRSYAYDLVTRDLLKSTYAAIISHERFRRDAAETLGLPDSVEQKVRVEVDVGPRDTTITVIATSPQREVSEQMAQATLESARNYVDPLAGLFVLTVAPSADVRSSRRHLPLSSPAGAGIIVAAGALALLTYAGMRLALS
ncbi:MAG: hypothetical protein ABR592_01145 [Nitriliruptorales bacterium]